MKEAIVMVRTAKMPATCWGRYARVGVVIVDRDIVPEGEPAMLSKRARGVVRVVETWEACHVGTTERCASARAFAEATTMAERCNRELA